MIETYLRQYWSSAVVTIAIIATGWYLFHLYQLVYEPLFIAQPTSLVTSSQYAIPQGKIDAALNSQTDKSIGSIDFSKIATPVTAVVKPTSDAASETVGTEGLTVSETAP